VLPGAAEGKGARLLGLATASAGCVGRRFDAAVFVDEAREGALEVDERAPARL
jgi:hypothetical protein